MTTRKLQAPDIDLPAMQYTLLADVASAQVRALDATLLNCLKQYLPGITADNAKDYAHRIELQSFSDKAYPLRLCLDGLPVMELYEPEVVPQVRPDGTLEMSSTQSYKLL